MHANNHGVKQNKQNHDGHDDDDDDDDDDGYGDEPHDPSSPYEALRRGGYGIDESGAYVLGGMGSIPGGHHHHHLGAYAGGGGAAHLHMSPHSLAAMHAAHEHELAGGPMPGGSPLHHSHHLSPAHGGGLQPPSSLDELDERGGGAPPAGLGGGLGGSELSGAPEIHSELMEAVMQQWLHTPAGQSAAQEAARLELTTEEIGQFFHARMLQSLGRLRLGGAPEPTPMEAMRPMPVGQLPEADEAAVERLAALGFDRAQAAEAYFACDRNENLAANLLMDSM